MLETFTRLMALTGIAVLAALPSSSNYKIHNYGFGAGGVGTSNSTNYSANAITGEAGNNATGTNYNGKTGNNNAQQANVPGAPTIVNTSNWYNKLKFTLDTGGNPSDAKFAIAISSDGFATTKYIQNDNTVGSVLGTEDYQTYAAWGGASGAFVIGLLDSTTYTIKVKAVTGNYTESGYSATAAATTSPPSLTYDIDVSATDSETSPPYNLDFGQLLPNSVIDAPMKIWIDFDTNGAYGGNVYIASKNSGLASTAASHTISSISGNLASTSEGEGAQVSSVAQTSGGPLASVSPFNGSSQNVGITSTTIQSILSSSSPIVAGRAAIQMKAKASDQTAADGNYSDVLTMIAAASF